MKIEEMTREELIEELKKHLVHIKKDIVTTTDTFKAGEWFHYTQDENGIFICSDEDPLIGVEISYDDDEDIYRL